jgi:hypothetical protein
VSQKSGTGGKGGEARRRGERYRIRGVGAVGNPSTRLSVVAHVEQGKSGGEGSVGGQWGPAIESGSCTASARRSRRWK